MTTLPEPSHPANMVKFWQSRACLAGPVEFRGETRHLLYLWKNRKDRNCSFDSTHSYRGRQAEPMPSIFQREQVHMLPYPLKKKGSMFAVLHTTQQNKHRRGERNTGWDSQQVSNTGIPYYDNYTSKTCKKQMHTKKTKRNTILRKVNFGGSAIKKHL